MKTFVWIALFAGFTAVDGFPYTLQRNTTYPSVDQTVHWDLETARELIKKDVPANQQFCSGTDLQTYQAAYQDVLAALATASTVTQSLLNYLNTNPTDAGNAKLTKQERLILYTFQIIYGQVLFPGSQTNDNQAGAGRVQTILNVINTMGNSMQGTLSHLEVHCDESWLTSTDPFGNGPPGNDGSLGFSAQQQGWVKKYCTNNANTLGWAFDFPYPSTGIDVTIVSFCPSWFPTWTRSQQQGSWRQAQGTTFANGQVTLDFFKGNYLGQTMAHEFSHAKAVVAGSALVDSNPTPYDWTGVTNLAMTNPTAAIANADSFAYYIIAQYFDNNSWLSGFSEMVF